MPRYMIRKLDGTFVAETEDIAEAVKLADETEGGAHFSEEPSSEKELRGMVAEIETVAKAIMEGDR